MFKAVNDFLRSSNLGTIATVSSDTGTPQSGIIYYYADDKGHIYFATAKNSRKLINIHKQAGVALVIGHDSKPVELQIEGTAREVSDTTQKQDVINKIALIANNNPKTIGWPPLLTLSLQSGVICIEMAIERFKYSDFSIHPGTVVSGTDKDLLFNYT